MPKSKAIVSSSDSDSETDDKPKQKKKKTEKSVSASSEKKSSSTKGPNGEAMFEIGRMRYATVSEFKGKTLISIREYYTTDKDELRPGKKGISLSLEQWNNLMDVAPEVDAAIKDI